MGLNIIIASGTAMESKQAKQSRQRLRRMAVAAPYRMIDQES